MARVFISYRRVAPDDGVAKRLYRKLSEFGHDVFMDTEGVPVGARWPDTIRESLLHAEWVVALVSLAFLNSKNCLDDELVIALDRLAGGQLAGVLPIRLAFAGDYPPPVRESLAALQAVVWNGPDDTAMSIQAIADQLPPPISLVKGMRAFTAIDAETFSALGRADEITRCVAQLAEPGVLVIHGVAGAGKTSFIHAGVAPALPPGTWHTVTASATPGDLGELAGERPTLIVDQFEQTVVALAGDAGAAAAFEDRALDWLAGAEDRRLVLVIRDEYRTPFEAILPRQAGIARRFALLPLRAEPAVETLRAICDSAQIDYDAAFLRPLVNDLADGVPPLVRPALLQLIAHEASESGARLDAVRWGATPASRRSFFEAHLRTAVLDHLPRSVDRVAAVRALRALTSGELKSPPRTEAEISELEVVVAPAVEHVLDLAIAPHARVVGTELDGGIERFQLVHDLFAGAIHSLAKREEAERRARLRRAVTIALGGLLVAALVLGGAAGLLWRRAEQRRVEAEAERQTAAQERTWETSSRLAAESQRWRTTDPRRALLLAAEALRVSDRVSIPVAERAIRDALHATNALVLDRHAAAVTALAVSPDGRKLASADRDGELRLWDLDDPTLPPRSLPGLSDFPVELWFTLDGEALIADAAGTLLRMELATGATNELAASGVWPVVSADGTLLVFTRPGDTRAWTYALSRSDATAVLHELAWTGHPTDQPPLISPHGRWIAIVDVGKTSFVSQLESLRRGDQGAPESDRADQRVHIVDLAASPPAWSDLPITALAAALPRAAAHSLQILAISDDGRLVVRSEQSLEVVASPAAPRPKVHHVASPPVIDPRVQWDMEGESAALVVQYDAKRICRLALVASPRTRSASPLDTVTGEALDSSTSDAMSCERSAWSDQGLDGDLRLARGPWIVTSTKVAQAAIWRSCGNSMECLDREELDRGGGELRPGQSGDPDAAGAPLELGLMHDLGMDREGRVLAASVGRAVLIWRLATDEPLVDDRQVLSTSDQLSPDAHWVAQGRQLWAVGAGGKTPAGREAPVELRDVVFSADETIAAVEAEGALYTLALPARPSDGWVNAGPSAGVQACRAGVIATRETDRTIRAHLPGQTPDVHLLSSSDLEGNLQVSDDRRTAIATDVTGNLQVWDLRPGGTPVMTIAIGEKDSRFALSPHGVWLAIWSDDASRLISLRSAASYPMPGSALSSPVMFSPDDRWAVVSDPSTNLMLWSLGEPTFPAALLALAGYRAAFDASAHHLMVSAPEGTQLWNLSSRGWQRAAIDGLSGTAAISPDGSWFVAASNNRMSFWKLQEPFDPRPVRTLRVEGGVTQLQFRPDGHQLAALVEGGVIGWDLDSLDRTTESFELGKTEGVLFRYSPDGEYLITEQFAQRGTQIWMVGKRSLLAQAERHTGRNFSVNEWTATFGVAPYRRTFPALPEELSRIKAEIGAASEDASAGHTFEAGVALARATDWARERSDPSLLRWICGCAKHLKLAAADAACTQAHALDPRDVKELRQSCDAR